jgi:type I restriction enzyme S subunit
MSESTADNIQSKEGYTLVQLGPKRVEIPEKWEKVPLEKLNCDTDRICYGVLKPGDDVPDGVPLIKIEDIEDNQFPEDGLHRITEDLHQEFSRSVIDGGEVLISVQGTIGRVARVPDDFDEGNISRTVARITPNNAADGRWLRDYLLSKPASDYMEIVSSGSTRSSLNIGDLRDVPVLKPPFHEQRRIAAVLSTVDEEIQQTEEIIEKIEELKQGLIQDLLLNGIDHETYRNVPMGPVTVEIPDDWRHEYFDDVVHFNPRDEVPERESYEYLPMNAVDEDERRVIYWEQRDAEDTTSIRFKNGDTVYAKITPCAENGKIALIDGLEGEYGYGSTEFLVFRPREGETIPRFVYYLANLPQFRAVTISLMEGSTNRQRIPTDIFQQNLRVPVPPIAEQRELTDRLATVDQKLRKERAVKQHLEALKHGLMQDLLTGQVRTPPDLLDAQPAEE